MKYYLKCRSAGFSKVTSLFKVDKLSFTLFSSFMVTDAATCWEEAWVGGFDCIGWRALIEVGRVIPSELTLELARYSLSCLPFFTRDLGIVELFFRQTRSVQISSDNFIGNDLFLLTFLLTGASPVSPKPFETSSPKRVLLWLSRRSVDSAKSTGSSSYLGTFGSIPRFLRRSVPSWHSQGVNSSLRRQNKTTKHTQLICPRRELRYRNGTLDNTACFSHFGLFTMCASTSHIYHISPPVALLCMLIARYHAHHSRA